MSCYFSRDTEESDEDDDGESGDENAPEDDMEVESNENQRPQADARPGDDEFNLANYDEEGRKRFNWKRGDRLITFQFLSRLCSLDGYR